MRDEGQEARVVRADDGRRQDVIEDAQRVAPEAVLGDRPAGTVPQVGLGRRAVERDVHAQPVEGRCEHLVCQVLGLGG